ncbi:histidine kinase N-terminal 7TM domain-containing protein [Cytobacillus praedii]|uniref:histidine kinase N-terminal 7TM domain-containing diguanylate cyclase n=1 Tax=Cytobacillus praedii TaxID=1742358 RepID=UPI002E1FD509|nr:histidine kinase N-terminal 7TM domain-containing protein [Cytobacillus praedii]
MAQELLLYVLVVVIAGLLSLFLCGYAVWKIKDAPGARYYILVTFMSAVFTFAYAFELMGTSLEEIRLWLRIEYLALPFIPVFILLMCLDYVGQRLKPWICYTLYVIPIITIFMHNTNSLHHLYYKSMKLRSDTPFPTIDLEGGPWFYIHSIFLFLCFMMSIIILLMQLKKSSFKFRMQILLMIAGLMIPLLANYFYINGLSPSGIDLGPVSMSISFLFHGIALVSFQMFNVTPIARDIVFENMQEGVIVLNQNNVIVDYNGTMLQLIPKLNKHAIGKPIRDVLRSNPRLAEIISNKQECDYKISLGGEHVYYHIRFSPVQNKKNISIGRIVTFANVTERVHIQEELKKLASTDGLTKVFNRTFFMEKIEEVFQSLTINGGGVSIIMFDIDHFKKVNDTFGHAIGDHILVHVADTAKKSLRNTDIMGRYGGEEFIICMANTPLYQACEFAETLREEIAKENRLINGEEVVITSSFGVSHAYINAGESQYSIHSLMKQADEALYAAKGKGRNCVQSYRQALGIVK